MTTSSQDDPGGQPTTNYDVAIVGAGPVGLFLALKMARAGHSVIVLEKQLNAYGLPRAVHFDDEVARLLAGAGLSEDLPSVTEPADFYEWRNAQGQTLLRFDWSQPGPSGWPTASMFSQPDLERLLAQRVAEEPLITVRRGEEVVQLTEEGDVVRLTARGVTVKHRSVTARYVVGCDGANSFVRQRLGAELTDLGFYFDWLVIDLIPTQPREWDVINLQVCDPARPHTVVSGGPGRRRFEFMRMPGETIADLDNDEAAWRLLEPWGFTPQNADLERRVVYTFQARWANQWNNGRLLIAGDAAHLMPPFAGQGMCSGIRDAANLAWKLDLVLREVADADLLNTYTSERASHVQHAIEQSVALGNVICVTDPEAVAQRDGHMLAVGPNPADVLPPLPPPRLGPGLGRMTSDGTPDPAAGLLALQPRVVTAEGETGLWDDVVGTGFAVIGLTGVRDAMGDEGINRLSDIGVEVLEVVAAGPRLGQVSDVDGLLLERFSLGGHVAMAVRPDNYIFGVASDMEELSSLVDQITTQLTKPAASSRLVSQAGRTAR